MNDSDQNLGYSPEDLALFQKYAIDWPGLTKSDSNKDSKSKSVDSRLTTEPQVIQPPIKSQEEIAHELEAKHLEEERKRAEILHATELKEKTRLEYQQKEAEREKAESKKRAEQLASARKNLEEMESAIIGDQEAWNMANAQINKLTNFRRTPVQEGTQAYYQCVAAAKTINEVDANTPKLKAEKARLEELIKNLEAAGK